MTAMDEYSAQLRVVRAALEGQRGSDLHAAVDQLVWQTSDVDVVELRIRVQQYDRAAADLNAAVAAKLLSEVRALVDSWDFAPDDEVVERARVHLSA